MRTIHLYGRLKDKFGTGHRLEVETAAEALRALNVNFKGFFKELEEGSFEVIRGKREGMHLTIEDVSEFRLGNADLHIVPVVAGSKNNGGIMKALLGVALIGAAIFMGPVMGAAGFATPVVGGSGITWGSVAIFGAVMALAGVSQMLSNTEKTEDETKDESHTMSGPSNFYEQGRPVPLVFGEVITGGVMISGGVDIEDIGAYQG